MRWFHWHNICNWWPNSQKEAAIAAEKQENRPTNVQQVTTNKVICNYCLLTSVWSKLDLSWKGKWAFTYFVSFSSMAKARTVRTFPRASSAKAVALETCAWAAFESLRNIEPNNVPPIIMTGNTTTIIAVSLGEITYSDTTHPIVCVVLRRPCEITCLKALLKSWISDVNLQL